MAVCNYLAPNNEKSLLAAALLQQYGPDVTARMWNYATAHMAEYTEFDVNGEPTMAQVMRGKNVTPQSRVSEDNLTLTPGALIVYKDTRYILKGINPSGKAQLITMEGTNYSGTPDAKNVRVEGNLSTVEYNGTDYVISAESRIISLATGKDVYTGADNSSQVQRKAILDKALVQNEEHEATRPRTEGELYWAEQNKKNKKPASAPKVGVYGFLGYKGGFKNTGKGTPTGDHKDMAMRGVAQGAIVELSKTTPSSSLTSLREYPSLHEEGKAKYSVSNEAAPPEVMMLARNGSLKGKPLHDDTKAVIESFYKEGVKFVVGDMPDVDSQFIDYLVEIGATFTIYHTGDAPRVTVKAEKEKEEAEPSPAEYLHKEIRVIGESVSSRKGVRMDAESMEAEIRDLIAEAKANPTTEYHIPYQSLNDKHRFENGYTAIEMALMFESVGESAPNITFSDSFLETFNAQPSRYAADFTIEDQIARMLQNMRGTAMKQQLNQLFVPIMNAEGKQIGNFTTEKQIAAVDTAMWFVYKIVTKFPGTKISEAFQQTMYRMKVQADKFRADGKTEQADSIMEVLNSFAFDQAKGVQSIAGLVIQNLERYGLGVKNTKAVLKGLEYAAKRIIDGKVTTQLTEDLLVVDGSVDMKMKDDSEDEFSLEEGTALRDYNDMVFELDPRDTASWKLKLFMANVEDTSYEPGSEVPIKVLNHLGFPKMLNFDDTYEKVMGLLADSKRDFASYDAKLRTAAKTNPMYLTVARMLKEADQSQRNEFVKVMSTHYQQFLMMTFNSIKQDDGTFRWILNPFEANRSSQVQHMIKGWQEAQKNSAIMKVVGGERVMDVEKVQGKYASWVRVFDMMLNKYPTLVDIMGNKNNSEEKINDAREALGVLGAEMAEQLKAADPNVDFVAFTKDPLAHMKVFVAEFMALNGIEFTPAMLEDLFDNIATRTKNTRYQTATMAGQFAFDKYGVPTGMFSSMVWKAAGWNKNYDQQTSMIGDESERRAGTVSNPLYTDGTAVKILARVAAAHTDLLTSPSHRNSEGKTIYDYSLNNALSLRMKELLPETQTEFDAMYEEMSKVHFAKNNFLLNTWKAGNREAAGMMMMDGLRRVGTTKGIVRTAMSDREQMLMAIGLFQNRNKDTAHYMSLTHSDKTMTPVFTNFPKVVTGGASTLNDNAFEAVENVFLAEWERIRQHWNVTFDHGQYNIGKKLFFTLPQFNYEAMVETMNAGTVMNFGDTGAPRAMTEKDIATLWVGEGNNREITNDIGDKAKKVISAMLNHFIEEMTMDTVAKWEDAGITNKSKATYSFDSSYVKKLMENSSYNNIKKSKGKWTIDGEEMGKREIYDMVVKTAARDLSLNYFLVNTSMAQLAYGDPAQAAKFKDSQLEQNTKGEKVLKAGQSLTLVNATYQEYSKRLAKDIAPGQDMAWEDTKYNTITIADVVTDENYIDRFTENSKLQKAYKEVDATDAQELTTVREHLKMLFAGGKIQEALYKEMMVIVEEGEKKPDGYYEFEKADHIAVIMQPAKPVFVAMRPEDRGTKFHDYIKSSSYPLYPPLTKNFEIDGLRRDMEKHGIARAPHGSSKKLGNPTTQMVLFSPEGKYLGGNFDDKQWKDSIHVLDRGGLRIQQEIPYDETKEAIKTLSQMNKLITESLAALPGAEFNVGGRMMNAAALRKYKESIRMDLINRNFEKFAKEMNYKDGEVVDKTKVLERLIQEARDRGFSENEISALVYRNDKGELEIPLMFSSAAEKFESTLMSMIKTIVDVKMPGKSYVQAASVGYVGKNKMRQMQELTEEERGGIVYANGYDASTPLKTMEVLEDGTVIPAQVIAPFTFTIQDETGKWVPANIKDYLLEDGKTLDMKKVPVELLQLVGARIPNQGHNSMLAIEIVGFTPASMGDLMIVPSAITKQMGADFDVDKLYTYKRPYKMVDGKFVVDTFTGAPTDNADRTRETSIKQFFAKLHGIEAIEDVPANLVETPELESKIDTFHAERLSKLAALPKPTDAQLKGQYFDVHWAVLTHKDVYNKVLNPLDKKDIKNENTLLKPKESGFNNYFNVTTQLSDFQSGKYAKTLVGLTSLSVTFNSVIQDKALELGNKEAVYDTEGNFVGTKDKPFSITLHKEDGTPIHLNKLSGYATSLYKNSKGEYEVRTKHDNLTTLQSAAVDNAKDRSLDNLNLTPDTYKAVAALMMLESSDGKPEAVDLRYATRMLTSPVIRKFSRLMADGNDSLSEVFEPDLKKSVIEKLKRPLIMKVLSGEEAGDYNEDELDYVTKKVLSEFKLTPESLLAEVNRPTDKGQLAILLTFEKLDRAGTRMTELQSIFNQDTKGAGPGFLAAADKVTKYQNLFNDKIETGILGEVELANGTEQAKTFSTVMYTAVNLVGQFFPYQSLVPNKEKNSLFDRLRAETGKTQLPIDLQKQVIKSMRSYVYSSIHTLWPDASGERLRLMYNIHGPSLAQRVAQAKLTWGATSYFMQRLDPQIGFTSQSPDFVGFNSAKAATYDENMNVSSFMEMLSSTDRDVKILAEDLIRYAYLSSGNMDASSFLSKIPLSYLIDSEFTRQLRVAEENINIYGNSSTFMEQFFQHFPDSAMQVDDSVFHADSVTFDEVFSLSPIDFKGYPSNIEHKRMVIADSKGDYAYPMYLSYNSSADGKRILYKRSGFGTYKRIDTLGNTNTDEYNGAVSGARSIFQENRAAAVKIAPTNPIAALTQQVNDLTESMENKENAYENFGMPKEGGGIEVAHQMLSAVANDDRMPESLRTVARVLGSTSEIDFAYDGLRATFADATPENFEVAYEATKDMDGTYDLNKSRLTLNKANGDRNSAAETLLHEMLHHRTRGLVMMSGFSPAIYRNITAAQKAAVIARIGEFNNKYPEVEKILGKLDSIRYQALVELRARVILEQGEEAFAKIMTDVANNEITTDDHLNLYALSSVDELISYSLTNKKVAAFLNTVQVKGERTLMEAIWDALTAVLDSIARTLGVEVRDGSALKEAITLSLKLATLNSNRDTTVRVQTAIEQDTTLEFETERYANTIKDVLEESYNKEVKISSEGTHIVMKSAFKHGLAPTAPVRTDVQKIIDKLEVQEKELNALANRVNTTTDEGKKLYQNIKAKRREVSEDINKLLHENQLEAVSEVGIKQLAWAKSIIAKDSPTPQEIMVAMNILDIWSTVIDLVYGGETDVASYNAELGELMRDARGLRSGEFAGKAQEVFTRMAGNYDIALSPEDYDKSLKEMFSGTQLFLTLARAESKLTATIGVLGTIAAENSDGEIRKYATRLEALKTKMEELVGQRGLPGLYKEFMQENKDDTAHGFVQRYSPEWFSHINKLESTLEYRLEEAKGIKDPDKRREASAAVYARYWKALSTAAVFVDTRIFFDIETGEAMSGTTVDTEMAYLVQQVGSEEHAQELIEEAGEQYKKYLDAKEAAFLNFEANELTEEEKAAVVLTAEELLLAPQEQYDIRTTRENELLEKMIQAEKDKWDSYESPNLFFESKLANNSTSGFGSSRFTVKAPRLSNDAFYDAKHKAIMATANKDATVITKAAIFEEFIAIRDELLDGLPTHVTDKMDTSFLPSVTAEVTASLMGKIGQLKPKSLLNRGFMASTVSHYEKNYKTNKDEIPLAFINTGKSYNLKEEELLRRQEQVAGWSKNLLHTMEQFSRMAIRHKHMSKHLDTVNVGEALIKSINKARLEDPEKGPALTKTIEAIEFMKKSVFFGNDKQAQAVSNEAIYSSSRKEHKKLSNEIKDLIEEREKLWEKMKGGVEVMTIEEDDRLTKIEERIEEITASGRYFAGSKAADMLISFNQLRALAFNPFAAITNFTFGMISVMIHANGRMDYTNKTARQAMHEMRHAQHKWLTFGAFGQDKAAAKIFNLMLRMNLINEVQSSLHGESNIDTMKKKSIAKAVMPLNWQLSGDYFTKGMMMIAMMKHKMVKVTEDGVEKEISLWDAHNSEGDWNAERFGIDDTWQSEDADKQKSWVKFRTKTKAVSTLVFGNQDANSKLMARKNVMWRMIGQFRMSWLPEGIATRFQDKRFDVRLDRDVKGRYRTIADLGILNSGFVLIKQVLSALPGVSLDAFADVKDRKREPISDMDKENMRKNLSGIAFTIGFLTAILTMKALLSPDEEEKKRRRRAGLSSTPAELRMFVNLLTRNYQDLTLYASPDVFDTVLGNPVPCLTVVTDAFKLLKASAKLLGDDPKRYEKLWKRTAKLGPGLSNISKFDYMTSKDLMDIGH